MLAVDFFGLGQETAPSSTVRTVTMPVVPDKTVVRCSYDNNIQGFRCTPVEFWEPPTVFLIAAGSIALLAVGYVLGRARAIPRYAQRIVEDPSAVIP